MTKLVFKVQMIKKMYNVGQNLNNLSLVLNINEQNAFCLKNKIVDSIITTHIKVFSTLVTFTKSNNLSPNCANIIIFPNRGRQRRHHVWRGTVSHVDSASSSANSWLLQLLCFIVRFQIQTCLFAFNHYI